MLTPYALKTPYMLDNPYKKTPYRFDNKKKKTYLFIRKLFKEMQELFHASQHAKLNNKVSSKVLIHD